MKEFIKLHRGEAHDGVFTLVNRSAAPLPLQVSVRFFSVQDEHGTVVFGSLGQGVASTDNPEAWLTLAHPYLLLEPHASRSVPYTLTVPSDAPLSTFTLAAIFQSKFPSLDEGGEAHAQLLPAISALFFVDVLPRPGEALPSAGALEVEQFAIPSQEEVRFQPFGASIVHTLRLDRLSFAFVEQSPLTFAVRLKNDGRYIARPAGAVQIKNMLGMSVGDAAFPEGAVLPGSARSYTLLFTKSTRVSSSAALPDLLRHSFFPGRYTARLTLAANSSYAPNPQPATLVFWAFPRRAVLSTGLPLTLLLCFMVRYRKRFVSVIKALLWQKS